MKALKQYPVITLTGARQCGKTSFLKNSLPDYKYVSLEEPELREFAESDPRGFFDTYNGNLIIDEVQNVPSLFSYIQSIVDAEEKVGRFILSGSQNFLLLEKVSQTLAGRCAIFHLSCFTFKELYPNNEYLKDNVQTAVDDFIIKGSYPAIYDRQIEPSFYYQNYKDTYVTRDVLMLKNIISRYEFEKFLKILSLQAPCILNLSALASDTGVSVPTIKGWLSVLEAGFIIFFLSPYYRNLSKRTVKSPKLYFSDTGLMLSLAGLNDRNRLMQTGRFGSVFENYVVSEIRKQNFYYSPKAELSFFRDFNGLEVDLIKEVGNKVKLIEIKSGCTFNKSYVDNINKLEPLFAQYYTEVDKCVLYRGEPKKFNGTEVVSSYETDRV